MLANREPYRHHYDAAGERVSKRLSSGVVNAVEPLLLEHSGVWVGEGVGFADRESATERDGLGVPAEAPRYRLRRVWLAPQEQQDYYCGFSNSALWPLCHRTAVEPAFYAPEFQAYELVNRRFADAVSEEAVGRSPIILVQDYHFALAPQLIRRQVPLGRIGTFWHIPWPRTETFTLCPWSRALLEGLLGSSTIGFQTAADREHFLDAAEHLLGARVDRDEYSIEYKDRRVEVAVRPASIDWPGQWAECAPVADCRSTVRDELLLDQDTQLAVGVDRLDYTKGLEQKFLAVERLLERRPELVGRFVMLQVAEPSRDCLPAYQQTRARVLEVAAHVNARFAGERPGPIMLLESHHSQSALARFFRAADLCYVGSLHDGMNLVSKEFVAARDDERGALILSAFAGASHELTEALIVNPYDIEDCARALSRALDMPPQEQRDRMRRMRRVVSGATARDWADHVLADVSRVGHEMATSDEPRETLAEPSPVLLSPPPAGSGVSVS